MGRSRDIDDETRTRLYGILQTVCVEESEMVATEFAANCSYLVTAEESLEIQPEDCVVDFIPVHSDFVKVDLFRTWYLSAYISFTGNRTLAGTVKTQVQSHRFETTLSYVSAFVDDTCVSLTVSSRDRCVGEADLITTPLQGDYGGFVQTKVMYMDDNLLVEYTCSKLTLYGTCARDGIQFNVYTSNQTINDGDREIINSLASAACLDPDDLEYPSEWCSDPVTEGTDETAQEDDCDVDNLDILSDLDDFNQDQVHGTWFEVGRSSGENLFSRVEGAVAFFTSDSNETMKIYYTGFLGPNNMTCSDVGVISLVSRCRRETNGDFLMSIQHSDGTVTLAPFKVIYTDYNNVLLTYACHYVTAEGNCLSNGAEINMWSRNNTISDDDYMYLEDLVFWTCVDPEQAGIRQNLQRETGTCLPDLNNFVEEREVAQVSVRRAKEEEEEDSQDHSEQRDQREKQLSDIDKALQMDDEEFYADT